MRRARRIYARDGVRGALAHTAVLRLPRGLDDDRALVDEICHQLDDHLAALGHVVLAIHPRSIDEAPHDLVGITATGARFQASWQLHVRPCGRALAIVHVTES